MARSPAQARLDTLRATSSGSNASPRSTSRRLAPSARPTRAWASRSRRSSSMSTSINGATAFAASSVKRRTAAANSSSRRATAAEHQAERGMVVGHPAEVTLEAQLGHRLAVSSTRRGLGDRRHESVADLVEERPIQIALGVEVLVEHRLGDAGRLGDVVHRRVVIAVHGERLEGHREDLFTPRGSGEANGHRYHRVMIHRPRSRSSRSAAFTA